MSHTNSNDIPDYGFDLEKLAEEASAKAEEFQGMANAALTPHEHKAQRKMARLLNNPSDKVILTKMFDQSFRAKGTRRVADQLIEILHEHGTPKFMSRFEQTLFQLFRVFGKPFSAIAVPCVIGGIRNESSRTIVSGEKGRFKARLAKRKQEGVRININHLGEAVLGERESQHRLDTYLKDLADPDIEHISIKISTIYSQNSALAFDHTVDELVQRLTRVYTAAGNNLYTKPDGSSMKKFVNLDMEEYRDLEITAAAFMKTLDKPEFKNLMAGIVLQAYLPDSFGMMERIAAWARARVEDGGAPIKIRIVKGANMEMEMVESALMNWPLATYDNKREVDANYKRMLLYGLRDENRKAIKLGIASHNLFELSFAITVAQHMGVSDSITYELLEGMGDHIRRTLQGFSDNVLLYAPVAERKHFINAIAYLIRRLDENTAPDNFLRYICDLSPDSSEWVFLRRQYFDSVAAIDSARIDPYRKQNRLEETYALPLGTYHSGTFVNEADTDWSRPINRDWIKSYREKWMNIPQQGQIEVPVVVGSEEIFSGRDQRKSFDPNRANENIHAYTFAMASVQDAERAVAVAAEDPDGWRSMSYRERHEVLSRAANEIRKARGDLIGCAALDTGKVFSEADVEVSEAIDFCEMYPFSARKFDDLPNVEVAPGGVGLVVSPWNFPIAIPCGGIIAMLAAGNTVIFKPASDSVLVSYEICQCIWRAGVSRNTLQFVPCSGSAVGPTMTSHPKVDHVVLTGSTETGMAMLKSRPSIDLAAETGGKNAIIVSSMSDRDLAVADIIHSAFSNCGQKCSAASLVILEKEVYEDPEFKNQLVDAAESLYIGSAWEVQNKLATLIKPPEADLKRALTELEPGESWALKPKCVDDNPYIWSPGIKWDVQRGGYTHKTEFFGPLLAVMCAENLEEAIDIANETGYGLTSGIHSLDKREQEYWRDLIIAGNLYINRGITGAIVMRQPFGGMRKSAIGAGIKAGGPNYVTQFMRFKDTCLPPNSGFASDHKLHRIAQAWLMKIKWSELSDHSDDLEKAGRAALSYLFQYDQEFGCEKDYFKLRGQDNMVRYLPAGRVLVRVHPEDSLFEILARCAAVVAARCELCLSIPTGLENEAIDFIRGPQCVELLRDADVLEEDDEALAQSLETYKVVRYASPDRVPEIVYSRAAELGMHIARRPVLMEGRIEMLHYFHEQSVCFNYHRYGNLGERSND